MGSNKIFFQFIAAVAVLALIFLISNPEILSGPTGLQTGACGPEILSSGTNGEVHSKIQDGGTESPCAMNACSAGMVEAGIFADKYKVSGNAYDKFTYYKICVKGTSANLKTCTSTAINDEGNLCTPPACGAGEIDLGTPADIRNYNSGTQRWDEVSYRLCVAGIDAGSMQWGEQGGSAPTPAACAAGQESSGLFGEIHFNEGGQYRAWRLCIKYTAPATTSSTTTTTEPPTTSSSSTTTPPTTSPGGTTSSSTPPTTSSGTTSSSTTTSSGSTTTSSGPTTTSSGSTTTTSGSGATAPSSTTTTLSGETTTTEPEVQMEEPVSEQDALSAIEEANTTIYSSSSTKNVSDALSLYSKAIDSYNNQDYFNAKAFALQAKISIKDYEGQKPSGGGNILFISIGAIALLALIAGAAYYFIKMKPKIGNQPKPAAPSAAPSKKI